MKRLQHLPIASLALLAAFGALLLAGSNPALAEAADSGASGALAVQPGIGGQVFGATAPLVAATVYAYDLAEAKIHKVSTDSDGRFLFSAIPAGLYKVIAHKPGFVPGVLKITRITADMDQFLELRLDEVRTSFGEPVNDYWKARAEVPSDVLRDIEMTEIAQAAAADASRLSRLAAIPTRFQTSMAVHSGVDEVSAGDSQVMGGKVGIHGRVGEMRVGLAGDFLQLEPATYSATQPGSSMVGETSALSLQMANDRGMELQVSSRSNRLAGDGAPVDLQHYRINVSSDIGEHGHSSLTAGYTSENNFHRRGFSDPMAVPEASRSWHLAGSYETHLTERASLQTGIRYRELEAGSSSDPLFGGSAEERFDVFGLGSQRLLPTMLVKYGIYASMVNGNMSLIPQGGVVVQLTPKWQASALASQKVDSDREAYNQPRAFLPVYFGETGGCDQNLQSCYQVTVSHLKSDEENLSLGAIHREYDEIEKLYFDEDFFNRFESLYLVPGDQLPELQFAISRRLSPNIHTRLESSVAQGGGGTFQAADRTTWENDVRYVVTSLDTQFQATATGVYLAFHHLNQSLESDNVAASAEEAFAVERLQVRLTQDLNFLRALAADWALNFNMELSRGSSPYVTTAEEDNIRKRLLGGIAVSF
ncbi:MAG: carboxypeptidase-like regulatory domain-containing protein [Acidobacteriota bacterium]